MLKAQLDFDKTQLRALVRRVQDAEKLRPGDAWFSLVPYNAYLQGRKRQKDVYSQSSVQENLNLLKDLQGEMQRRNITINTLEPLLNLEKYFLELMGRFHDSRLQMDFAMARAQCKIVYYSEEEYARQLDAVKGKMEKYAEKTSAKVQSTSQYFNSNEGKINPGPYIDKIAQCRQQVQYASRFDQVTKIGTSIDTIWKNFIGDARKIGCEAEQLVRETNLKIKIMKTQTEKI